MAQLIKEVGEGIGSGWAGVHVKPALAGALFALSRN